MEDEAVEESKLVNKVAEALYKQAREDAKKAIDAFTFDTNDLVNTIKMMASESMTARVIVFGSYLEEKTIELMKLHMRPMNASGEESLFGASGPLGTFSARINMAYFLNWITEKQRNNLHSFRKIRNLFAHEAYKISISDPRILSHLKNIDVDVSGQMLAINEALYPTHRISTPLSSNDEFIFKMIYVAGLTFIAFLAGPTAVSYRIFPNSLFGDFDDMPEKFKKLKKRWLPQYWRYLRQMKSNRILVPAYSVKL